MTTMRRRDFVKAIVAASATASTALGQQAPSQVAPSVPPPAPTAPGPVPWMRGLMEKLGPVDNRDRPRCRSPHRRALLHHAADSNATATLRDPPASTQRLPRSYRRRNAGVPRLPHRCLPRGSPTDIPIRPRSSRRRGEATLRHILCSAGQDTSRSTAPTLAQNMDDRSPSNRAIRILHQHRPQ